MVDSIAARSRVARYRRKPGPNGAALPAGLIPHRRATMCWFAARSELAKDPESALSTVLGMARSTGVDAFCRQQAAIAGRRDQRGLLERVRVPSLLLCGRQDALIPFAVHQQVAAALARSPGLEPDALSPVVKPAGSRAGSPSPVDPATAADGAAPPAEQCVLMMRVLEDCGHLPTVERPDETSEALFDWLALPSCHAETALLP